MLECLYFSSNFGFLDDKDFDAGVAGELFQCFTRLNVVTVIIPPPCNLL